MARTYKPCLLPALSWHSQRVQYPETREPGFHLDVEHIEGFPEYDINCLLLYGMDRKLVAILNYYPQGFPDLEVPRAINIWVDPARQKRGIGMKMLAEFERRFGPIDWDAQRVTPAGMRLAEKFRGSSDG